jgi:predicted dehydrogenase
MVRHCGFCLPRIAITNHIGFIAADGLGTNIPVFAPSVPTLTDANIVICKHKIKSPHIGVDKSFFDKYPKNKNIKMPKNKKIIKFGVIGAGKIGSYHARTIANLPQAELIGVCDADSVRAQRLAWKYNCLPYSKYKDLIEKSDAVVVAVPTELHMEVGSCALSKKVHCLIEKPIASTEEQARQLLKLSEKKDALLQVGHSERFNPAIAESFKHIKNPRFVTIQRLGPYDPRMQDIGVVLDLMIHDIDLILTMFAEPIISFDAIGASIVSDHEDIANVRFRFKSGAVADVTASRVSFEKTRFMRVYQESAYISVDLINAKVKKYAKKSATVKSLKDIEITYPPVGTQMPIQAEILHFIDCIHKMKTPWPSGERGLEAVALALDITDQLQRYEVPKIKESKKAKPGRMMSDMGKAAKVIIDETLHNIGIDKT